MVIAEAAAGLEHPGGAGHHHREAMAAVAELCWWDLDAGLLDGRGMAQPAAALQLEGFAGRGRDPHRRLAAQGQMQEAVIGGDHEALQPMVQRQSSQAAHGFFDGVELALHVGAHIGEAFVAVALAGLIDADAGDHHRAVAGEFLQQRRFLAADHLHQVEHHC